MSPAATPGRRSASALALFLALAIFAPPARAEGLLATIKARADLVCGVSSNSVAFSMPDSQGVFHGEVDVLFQSSTWTMGRETVLGFRFAAVNYFGGMGILSHTNLGITKAPEKNGTTVCISPGSTNEVNLQEYFRSGDSARQIRLVVRI